MKKRFPWFEIILTVVFLGAQMYAAFSDSYNLPNNWYTRDDAYYYFKVAQNISEGHGSTFDGIHPTNGYHPLWLLICIPIFALARFDLILPLRILLVVTSLLQVGTSLLLYKLLKGIVSHPAAMLAAIYWTFDINTVGLLYRTGMESGIALFMIALFLYLLYAFEKKWRDAKPSLRQIAMLGIVGILVIFARLDLVFLSFIVGIWIVFRASPIRYLLPLDILAVLASALTAFILRLGIPGYYNSVNAALVMIIAGLIIKTATFYFTGLYRHPSNWHALAILKGAFFGTVISSLLMTLFFVAGSRLKILPPFSLVILLMDALLTFVFVLVIRLAVYSFHSARSPVRDIPPLDYLKLNWAGWLKEGSVYYGIVGGTLAVYMLWNKLVFGTFSPVSGQIKRWWATYATTIYGSPPRTPLSFLMMDPSTSFNAWNPFASFAMGLSDQLWQINHFAGSTAWEHDYVPIILGILAIVGGILFLQKRKTVRAVAMAGIIPLFVGGWLQALSYSITGYIFPQEWYWLPELILLLITAALLIDAGVVLLSKWMAARVFVWTLTIAAGVYFGYGFWSANYTLMPYGVTPATKPYMDVASYLERLTQPGAVIGMTGGGNVGYFIHDRTIVNMDGLINSFDYFQAVRNGSGADYLYAGGMRYIFVNPDIIEANPYRGQYTNRYKIIDDSWGGKDLMEFLPSPAP